MTQSNHPVQDLSQFRLPPNFRGRSAAYVQLWWLVQALLFHSSPQVLNGLRCWLLRRFGAQVGRNVIVRPSVTVTYPWKVTIGDYAQIGYNVTLYSLGPIFIGEHAVVSQESYLCAGSHDYNDPHFAIFGREVRIEPEAWVAARSFVHPGVTVGRGAVVAACSVVTKDVAPYAIVAGMPAKVIGSRLQHRTDAGQA